MPLAVGEDTAPQNSLLDESEAAQDGSGSSVPRRYEGLDPEEPAVEEQVGNECPVRIGSEPFAPFGRFEDRGGGYRTRFGGGR